MTPSAYPPPVGSLLSLGEKGTQTKHWTDYRTFGLTVDHVPALLDMVKDAALDQSAQPAEHWAPLHAWRALGQLGSMDVLEPMIALADAEDDWVLRDLPLVAELLGPRAIPVLARELANAARGEFARAECAAAIAAVANSAIPGPVHDSLRDECGRILADQLSRFAEHTGTLNGLIVSALMDLRAVEHADLMERVMTTGPIDLMVAGDWQDVQVELGLISERTSPRALTPLQQLVRDQMGGDDVDWDAPAEDESDPRRRPATTAPAVSAKVERNGPCPCGSGRKFKKCHGAPAMSSPSSSSPPPEAAIATRLKAADLELSDDLMRFARARISKDWADRAITEYLGDADGEMDQSEFQIAVPWIQFQLELDDGQSLAARFLAERGHKLTGDKRALLEAGVVSWYSAREVRRVDRGVGILVADLFTGAEHFIHDVSLSRSVTPRATLLASVVTCGGVSFFGGAHPRALAPGDADALVTAIGDQFGFSVGHVEPIAMRDPEVQTELLDSWRAMVDEAIHRPPPAVSNTDGDPLLLTVDHFVIESGDGGALVDRLSTLAGADPPTQADERGSTIITVAVPGNAQHRTWTNTLIGRLIVTSDTLRIETNSTRRADRLRDAVIAHVGAAVRFRMRDEITQQDLAARAGRAPRGSQPEAVPPELAAAVRELKERHMMAWLDESIPALGGLTPREAAVAPASRTALELLLREIEHHEGRGEPEQRFDVRRLRDALGMP